MSACDVMWSGLWLLQNSAVPHPGRKEMTSKKTIISWGDYWRSDGFPKDVRFSNLFKKKHGLYKKRWNKSTFSVDFAIVNFIITTKIHIDYNRIFHAESGLRGQGGTICRHGRPILGVHMGSMVKWWSTSNVKMFFGVASAFILDMLFNSTLINSWLWNGLVDVKLLEGFTIIHNKFFPNS